MARHAATLCLQHQKASSPATMSEIWRCARQNTVLADSFSMESASLKEIVTKGKDPHEEKALTEYGRAGGRHCHGVGPGNAGQRPIRKRARPEQAGPA